MEERKLTHFLCLIFLQTTECSRQDRCAAERRFTAQTRRFHGACSLFHLLRSAFDAALDTPVAFKQSLSYVEDPPQEEKHVFWLVQAGVPALRSS